MRCITLVLALLLTACSGTQIQVTGIIPSPLREPLPFDATLVLEDRLRTSIYRGGEGRNLEIAIGIAQTQMFQSITQQLFQTLDVVSERGRSQTELILIPELREIQVATPRETQLKIYEIWLRYLVHVHDAQDTEITSWPLSAYGKTQSQFMRSDEAALNQAALIALRDAGARLTLEFETDPRFQRWIQQHGQATSSAPPPADPIHLSQGNEHD